ncbi:hypothetical protein TUM19329_08080 [Legionella antarctica]|uniref:Coiled-coil protein n=1 Tax=Legionella antarctica TaxID=2708020 RepID=A0A6F8T2P7_9GAMM|nr:histidine phosphatase family protein [Legionella antarctica]BCA94447.1 hypothetical protein TUM19329_08080 [Legionella antarctica]
MGQGQIINIDPASDAVISYQQNIKSLINTLNVLNPDKDQNQINEILGQIKAEDQQFILKSGLYITGHVLFSRHGESALWSQKKLGLNPNAALAQQAMGNMSHSNKFTSALLGYPDKRTLIAVSPLVRAKQTASLIIPAHLKSAQIIIQPTLSENSFTPSGKNITSLEQLTQEYNQMSFWRTPIKVILFKLSIWFYGYTNVFEQIQKKSSQADEIMLNISGVTSLEYFSQGRQTNEEGCIFDTNSLSEDQKITTTRQLIRDNLKSDEGDFWLFGHGNNFKNFFNKTFGIKSAFEYGETRCVYNIQKDSGLTSLFSPPYIFVIDQSTGRIRGKYTEHTLAFEINLSSLSLVSDSTKKMHEGGLDLTKPHPAQVNLPELEVLRLEQPKTFTVSQKHDFYENNTNSDTPAAII